MVPCTKFPSVLSFLLAFLVMIPISLGDEPPQTPDEVRRELFDWFDSLGYPDVTDLPFIQCPGIRVRRWAGPIGEAPSFGFLLSRENQCEQVLTLELTKENYDTRPPAFDDHNMILIEMPSKPVDFREYAEEALAVSRGPLVRRNLSDKTTPQVEPVLLFALARFCEQKGHGDIASKLYDRAKQVALDTKSGTVMELKDIYARDLLRHELQKCFRLLRDEDLSRSDVLAAFHKTQNRFAGVPFPSEATVAMDRLAQMVREDDELSQRPLRQTEEKDGVQRWKRLIWQLRDQENGSWRQPISQLPPSFPARKLRDAGPEVIPLLVEAVTDPNLTRDIVILGIEPFPRVVTVGDWAERLLEEKLGREFFDRTDKGSLVSAEGKGEQIQQQIKAWIATAPTMDDKERLTQLAANEQAGETSHLETLAAKYPSAASPYLTARLPSFSSPVDRINLVRSLAETESEEVKQVLLQQLATEQDTQVRLVLASVLGKWRSKDVANAIISDWHLYCDQRTQSESVGIRIGKLLIQTQQPEAVKAVADRLTSVPVLVRLTLLDAIAKSEFGLSESLRVEFLTKALEDTSVDLRLAANWPWLFTSAERVCDHAGRGLNEFDPERFFFATKAPIHVRDCQRMAILQRIQGNDRSPEAAVISPPVNEADRLLVAKWLAATTELDQQQLAREVQDRGLAILPEICRQTEGMTHDEARRERVLPLLQRGVRLVREVRVAEASVPLPLRANTAFASLIGRPIDLNEFGELIDKTVNELPAPAAGMYVSIVRWPDETGLVVYLDLLTSERVHAIEVRSERQFRIKAEFLCNWTEFFRNDESDEMRTFSCHPFLSTKHWLSRISKALERLSITEPIEAGFLLIPSGE